MLSLYQEIQQLKFKHFFRVISYVPLNLSLFYPDICHSTLLVSHPLPTRCLSSASRTQTLFILVF
jgi:hypothetical protein